MEKTKISIFDRILDEVISSTYGGLHWQIMTTYIFPNMTEIDAKAIIDEIQNVPNVHKYFKFLSAGDRIVIAPTNDTNLLKHYGGFAYLFDKHEKEKQRQQPTTQHLTINAPVTGSQLGLSSDFGDLDFKNASITPDPTINAPQPKKDDQKIQELSIWNKIYKWTDHKLISGIILLILGFYISRIFIWLGWLPCP